MTTTTKTIARPIAALNLPKKVPALLTYAQGIVKGVTGNPSLPAPTPTLAAIQTAISELATAETAALSRQKGAVITRNEKRAVLVALLQQLRAYAQAMADATPENGGSIIASAGMALRKPIVRAARIFAAKPSGITGSVKLVAPAAARRSSYEWEYSTDGGATWVTAPPSLQAKTVLTGLKAGTTVQFRYRPVVKTGGENWSQPVSLLVQ
jgi:hypothetical protein